MAAGLASRYGSCKQIARVGPHGEILMEYAIYDALKAGFGKIVLIIKPDMLSDVRSLFGDRIERSTGIQIQYAFQELSRCPAGLSVSPSRTKPLGTVHAVLCAGDLIDGPFAVINADDFYGREAFMELGRALPRLSGAGDSAMVAYLLKNTVSPHGTVTRGVCHVADGKLAKVTETYKIRLFPGGSIQDTSDPVAGVPLDPDCFVSMNMWGFHPGILEEMERYFSAFLRDLAGDDNSSECLLPMLVDKLIAGGRLETAVLSTGGKWFGLTHPADREDVAAALSPLHAEGIYPPSLW
ncbi:MAG: sugar phosphate nucleotidyltransferase [Oscillospiraceae bacterium]